jgi:hypothetical protein
MKKQGYFTLKLALSCAQVKYVPVNVSDNFEKELA